MRKMLLAGLAALLVLLVLPGAVSAASDMDNVTVSGTIGPTVALSVAPAAIPFATMLNGTPATGSSVVNVTTNSASWSVTATDAKATNNGYMTTVADGTGLKLAAKFNFGQAANPTTYLPDPSFMSGTAPAPSGTTKTAYVRQVISVGDAAGVYQIVITFTANAN